MKAKTKSALSDLESMWAQIDAAKEAHCGKIIARPANSFTSKEFADKYNMSFSHACNVLADMSATGKLVKVRAYVPDSLGRPHPANVYMLP